MISVYDTSAVFMVVKIIDSFYSEYENRKALIHNFRFDYNILKQAMKIIMENDHSLCVAKILWVYYKNAHIMNIEHVSEVYTSISENKFYATFFHWSWQVRNIFYYFLLYTINFRLRNMNFLNTKENVNTKGIRRGSIGDVREVANYPEMVTQII